jgi:hypothetical protein
MKLGRLGLKVGASFTYVYDFGDDWRHRIEVESTEPASENDWLPRVIDGARRGPPEDCGGPAGYEEIQAILDLPESHLDEEAKSILEWLGDGFDPNEFSLAQKRHAVMLASAWGVLRRKR